MGEPVRQVGDSLSHRQLPVRPALCFICSVGSLNTGMPLCTLKLVKHFAETGHYDVLCILPEEGEFSQALENSGVHVVVIPFVKLRSVKQVLSLIRFIGQYIPLVMRMRSVLVSNRIALVHFSDFIDLFFYPCILFTKARSVAHLRLIIESGFVRRIYGAWASLWVRELICISRAAAQASGAPARILNVIYDPGPDPVLFDPARYKRVRPTCDDQLTVVTVAQILEDKGIGSIVRIARLVEDMIPGRIVFHIIGDQVSGHEAFYRTVMDLIGKMRLQQRIRILGRFQHAMIPEFLAQSEILLHVPHYQEGLGGVIFEAMAMRLPVIAYNSGGVGECFEDGRSGFLVKQFDVEAAAQAVVCLARNLELCFRMGAAAQKELATRFSYAAHFVNVGQVYAKVLGRAALEDKQNN